MRRGIFIWATAIVIGVVMLSVAMAQKPHDVASLDQFLNNHPWVAKRLAADPKLADDPQFLTKHSAFKTFLAVHPEAREQIPAASKRYVDTHAAAPKSAVPTSP